RRGGGAVGGVCSTAHPLEDGRLLLVIGDVMGHGPQAAARMGQLRAVLAAYAYDGDPPDRVLAHVSARAPALLDLPMATALAGIYDPATRRLTFALAGHLPPHRPSPSPAPPAPPSAPASPSTSATRSTSPRPPRSSSTPTASSKPATARSTSASNNSATPSPASTSPPTSSAPTSSANSDA